MGGCSRFGKEHIRQASLHQPTDPTRSVPAPAEGPVTINRHLRRLRRRTDAALTPRHLRLIQEASTSTHRNDLLAVATSQPVALTACAVPPARLQGPDH